MAMQWLGRRGLGCSHDDARWESDELGPFENAELLIVDSHLHNKRLPNLLLRQRRRTAAHTRPSLAIQPPQDHIGTYSPVKPLQ